MSAHYDVRHENMFSRHRDHIYVCSMGFATNIECSFLGKWQLLRVLDSTMSMTTCENRFCGARAYMSFSIDKQIKCTILSFVIEPAPNDSPSITIAFILYRLLNESTAIASTSQFYFIYEHFIAVNEYVRQLLHKTTLSSDAAIRDLI